jgi:hypothetical protein
MKPLMALTLGMLLASTALAQSPQKQNEFFVGVGDASLIFMIDDIATTIGTLGTVTYDDTEGGIQVVGGYQRRLGTWASVGVTGSWAGARRTMHFFGEEAGQVERRVLTVMADARGHWLRRPSLDLYSGLALGAVQWSDDWESVPNEEDFTHFGFHVIPVGVRVGRDLGVFLESGVGWHNLLKAGLSGRW